jgi:hypothetical protein
MALLLLAACTPIKPVNDYKFSAGNACMAPVKPVGYSDMGAISNYQAKRDKFIDCVAHEDPSSPSYQSDLAQSKAMIGDDQLGIVDTVQRHTR